MELSGRPVLEGKRTHVIVVRWERKGGKRLATEKVFLPTSRNWTKSPKKKENCYEGEGEMEGAATQRSRDGRERGPIKKSTIERGKGRDANKNKMSRQGARKPAGAPQPLGGNGRQRGQKSFRTEATGPLRGGRRWRSWVAEGEKKGKWLPGRRNSIAHHSNLRKMRERDRVETATK